MGQALMSYMVSLAPVDAWTFKLVLKQPIGFVIDAMAKIDSNVPFMMLERIATDPNEQITEVIGSGLFRFVKDEWVPGSKVCREKFTDYVPRGAAELAAGGKVVYVDRVGRSCRTTASRWRHWRAANSTCTTSGRRTVEDGRGQSDVVIVPNDRLATSCSWRSIICTRRSTTRRCGRQMWGMKGRVPDRDDR
jgi:hypothetical protein